MKDSGVAVLMGTTVVLKIGRYEGRTGVARMNSVIATVVVPQVNVGLFPKSVP